MSQNSQFSLLSQRRFAPFFWTQFFGAFNDNLFKTALMVILTYDALSWTTLDPSTITNLIPGLFILPYVVFSATAGQLADKFEKAGLARFVKWMELAIMAIAAAGWMTHTLWLLVAAVVGMGIHSTLFGPVKYAYLPQQLKPDELIGGNGLIEMGTFVGILLGEILGAVLVVYQPWGIQLVAGATVAVALLGLVASYRVPRTPAPEPDLQISWNPLMESIRNIGFSRKNRPVFLAMLGNSWFWFYGALILAQFPVYAKNYLHGGHGVFVLLLTVFSLGIGAGSLLCERLSGHKVEIGLVPFGSIGLSLFGIDLFFASNGYHNTGLVEVAAFLAQAGVLRILFDIVMIGLFGGFFIVPLFALIQVRCDPRHISRTIAGMNILNALFMVAAAGVAIVLLGQGFTIPQLFLITAILNALVAVYIFSLVPEFLVRFLAWLLIHTVHRVKVVDGERIPKEGAAVLVCNHVSYVDAIVIMAASPRPIRFVMDHRIFKMPLLGWLFLTAKAIPIAPAKEDPFLMEKAFVDIAQALHEGDLVCIFPEGKLTRTGQISEFRGGIAKILARSQVPVIPLALRGLWGHLLSHRSGHLFERAFKAGMRSRLSLAVGLPVAAADATPELLQQQVQQLRGNWK
ncbi:MFS transporter [Janthinobacterium agaricidamnosum]|uniref:Major Facilitator Superfamily protein n=1 Tax=Janthinobacterium agaricidamnosum NBRC 102515 = DSM 9628 TaxID=1349767 RepID=W0V986_9BURK|nr:MFS transporter [Janthinobacterium agaricidamnosum]CDG84160.1 major Facilitator Superfamily protein [Janthinobacterium agaricidamnosum NBRC 102515 = DSM 9628]